MDAALQDKNRDGDERSANNRLKLYRLTKHQRREDRDKKRLGGGDDRRRYRAYDLQPMQEQRKGKRCADRAQSDDVQPG